MSENRIELDGLDNIENRKECQKIELGCFDNIEKIK